VGANAVLSNLSVPVHTDSQGHVFHSLQAIEPCKKNDTSTNDGAISRLISNAIMIK
jgi:hypothetical protein